MTTKEAIEILKESADRNKKLLELGADMMSGGVVEWVNKETEALTKAISLLEAEGEGLIVRLPCKVGTKLYTIESKESEECDQDRIVPWIIWKIEYIDSDNTTDGQNQITIYYERTDDIFYDDRSCELDDIGKTVFLTREESAAKVEGMK
jgi:hypothetical protein